MSIAETIALWALVISAITLLVYLGQLVVLILVYRRVIKEADRNAEIRKQEIEKAGGIMREQGKYIERELNKMVKRNTIAFSIGGVCLAIMILVNRTLFHRIERSGKL